MQGIEKAVGCSFIVNSLAVLVLTVQALLLPTSLRGSHSFSKPVTNNPQNFDDLLTLILAIKYRTNCMPQLKCKTFLKFSKFLVEHEKLTTLIWFFFRCRLVELTGIKMSCPDVECINVNIN
jgi:hypothetical protein